ncbi:hypothetical protein C1H46_025174 [Malus baccata]|uniref:AAA+ ATPase domain-containing protein n=1 Tax=Malus baccata TaxID=106549 RepID=A0A540LS74_MALBA|nr:hypothetical protein C1H46_025174 [Malus baccata]
MESHSSSSSSSSMNNGNNNKEQWRAEDAIAGNAEALMSSQRTPRLPSPLLSSSPKARSQMASGFASLRPSRHWKDKLAKSSGQGMCPHSVHKAHAGESEKFLREAFAEASSLALSSKPSVIFIDEIDALCPHRDSRREQDVHIASQLFTLLDSTKMSSASVPQVVVVASTNRRKVPLDTNVDLHGIAASCNGFVGADLEALCREAAMSAIKRHPDGNKDAGLFSLTIEDWKHARSVVGPSITRGVTVEIPKVTWEDIGGLNDLKKKLQQAVE